MQETNEQEGMVVRPREDWLPAWIGLLFCVVALAIALVGRDLLGWGAMVNVWTDITKSFSPVSKSYAWMPGYVSAICTWLLLLLVMVVGAKLLKGNLRKFGISFSIIFWVSLMCMFVGSWAPIAATPNQQKAFGLAWSFGLTGEAGLILALIVGLAAGNFFPAIAKRLEEAAKPDWYIRIGLVLLGVFLGVQTAGAMGLAKIIFLRGFVAASVVYLVVFSLVFIVLLKLFHFNPEEAAVIAAALSICGVAAAAAIACAVKARRAVWVMVASIVVVFSAVELLILPFIVGNVLYRQPLVAGSFMAMTVKTDGAAVAAGTITQAVIQAKTLAVTGMAYKGDWILMTTSTEKVLIDLFIAVFAFILAWIWTRRANKSSGEKVRAIQIWERFPKFILGCAVAFFAALFLSLHSPEMLRAVKLSAVECNGLRTIFFAMTFFTIGLKSDFRSLWKQGLGKMVVAYTTCLVVIVIPIGFAVSWLFFHGIMPPAK